MPQYANGRATVPAKDQIRPPIRFTPGTVSRIPALRRLTFHLGYRDKRRWLSQAFGGHRDHVSQK